MNQENISSGFVSRFIVLICECRGVKNDNELRGQKWPDIVTPSFIQFPSSQLGFGSISRGLNIVLLEWGNLSVVKILYYLHSCGGPSCELTITFLPRLHIFHWIIHYKIYCINICVSPEVCI